MPTCPPPPAPHCSAHLNSPLPASRSASAALKAMQPPSEMPPTNVGRPAPKPGSPAAPLRTSLRGRGEVARRRLMRGANSMRQLGSTWLVAQHCCKQCVHGTVRALASNPDAQRSTGSAPRQLQHVGHVIIKAFAEEAQPALALAAPAALHSAAAHRRGAGVRCEHGPAVSGEAKQRLQLSSAVCHPGARHNHVA